MGWIKSQVDIQFFLCWVQSTILIPMPMISFFLCCVFLESIVYFSMNTYFPCPRNNKMSHPIDYSRNCSNFLGLFSFLPFIQYPPKNFMQLSIYPIVVVCLLVEYLEIFHFHLLYMFTSLLFPNFVSLCLLYCYEIMSQVLKGQT